jgi:hypothetical protein
MGAFIGAATPFAFWMFTKYLEKRKKNKEDLFFVEKEIVAAINNLADIKETLTNFLNTNVTGLQKIIQEVDTVEAYCGSSAYMPMFHVHALDENLSRVSAGSGYLDNELLKIISYSRELKAQMEDIRLQFESTVNDGKIMAHNKINNHKFHNDSYSENLERYKKMVRDDVIGKNLYTYLRSLTRTYVVTMELRKMGSLRWYLKFSSSFKFFVNSNAQKKYRGNAIERIDAFIDPIYEIKHNEFLKKF